jgi:hypothetical protein
MEWYWHRLGCASRTIMFVDKCTALPVNNRYTVQYIHLNLKNVWL